MGIIIIAGLLLLVSCRFFFNEIILTNRCKKCSVININSGDTLWSEEGCGGNLTRLDDKAKIQAFEKSRKSGYGNNLCTLKVSCKSWKKEKNESD